MEEKIWKEPTSAHIVQTARRLKVKDLIEKGEQLPGYMGDSPIQYKELYLRSTLDPELAWCRAVVRRIMKKDPKGGLNVTFMDWYWYQKKSDEEIDAYILSVWEKVEKNNKKKFHSDK